MASRTRRLRAELLERREMLTGAGDWYSTVSPAWFQAAETPRLLGNPYHDAAAVSRWVVRLDEEFSRQMGSAQESWKAFAPAFVVSSEQVAPWYAFRPLTGLGLPGQLVVESFISSEAAESLLKALPHVASAELERTIGGAEVATAIPNDPRFGEQTQLGLIDVPQAWNIETGKSSVVVALIDSGVDYTHPDLAANIWRNTAEIPGNGLDDDKNEFIDDYYGYDFVNKRGDPFDDNGHGTHVAGTIAAVGNNGVGVSGVAWNAQIMPLKFLDRNLKGTTTDAIKAFNYMVMMKTRVTNAANIVVSNNSWGFGGGIDVGLRQAVEAAGRAGILTVAAAGNGNGLGVGIDNNESPFYPASFSGETILSVAASDGDDFLARFSNFGRTSVDIAAPGLDILSTLPGGGYGTKNGTSMATAHVTGAAALVYSEHPAATPEEVRMAILEGANTFSQLAPRLLTGGRLNAHGALTANTFAPKATVVSAPDVTSASNTSDLRIVIRYEDDSLLDPASFSGSNLSIQRVGFTGEAFELELAGTPTRTPPQAGQPDAYNVSYRLIAPDLSTLSYFAALAGEYVIRVQANQVVNDSGLAVAAGQIGGFRVTITDPHVFIVNTTDDTVDSDLTDGNAKDAKGNTSLRAAVMQANHSAINDGEPLVIVLKDGIYRLNLPEAASAADPVGERGGDLDILANIRIPGTGVSTTVIDAQAKSRVFELIPRSQHPLGTPATASSLSLTAMTIKNGRDNIGGGILVGGDAAIGNNLTIDHGVLAQNSGNIRGGAIASTAASNIVTITATTIDGNATQQSFGDNFGGGGIYNEGTLSVTASTISNNVTPGGLLDRGGGGGVLHAGPGHFSLLNSTISTNTATQSNGGGLTLQGSTTIENATITKNAAPRGSGGGLYGDPAVQGGARVGHAVDGNSIFVVLGAPGATAQGLPQVGAAFIYLAGEVQNPLRGDPYAILPHPEAQQGADFGAALAIGGGSPNKIVVGAPGQDDSAADAGVAYVFDANGELLFALRNPAPAEGDRFGSAVAIGDGLIVVGASHDDAGAVDSGRVYVFSATTGALLHTVSNPTPGAGDLFGTSVSIAPGVVVAGAPNDDAGAVDAGVVHVFNAATGLHERTILNPAPATGDRFGAAVSGDRTFVHRVAIGAPGDDAGAIDSGRAYVFSAATGGLIATLDNPTPAVGDAFGNAVSVGRLVTIAVGAYLADDKAPDGGMAYLFQNTLEGHALVQTFEYGNGTDLPESPNDHFGFAVSADVVGLIGAPGADIRAPGSGGAFQYNSPTDSAFWDVILTPAVGLRLEAAISEGNSSSTVFGGGDVAGWIWDNGGNLIGSDEVTQFGFNSFVGIDTKLGPLQDNGGPTFTHDLLPGSPAVDGAGFFGTPIDQRGFARPQFGAVHSPYFSPLFGGHDAGAIEKFDADISGTKFIDDNGNGVRDVTERGIPGQTIFLDLNDNGRLDIGEPRAETSADNPDTANIDEAGSYFLPNIPAGPYLLSTAPATGVLDAPHHVVARNVSSTFRRLADTSTPRPGGGGNLTLLRPPVIGNGAVLFAEGSGGATGSRSLIVANAAGSLSTKLVTGQALAPSGALQSIVSYDYDGDTVAATTSNQLVIASGAGAAQLVSNYSGAITSEVSVGNGFVAYRTSAPDQIYISAINALAPGSITTARIAHTLSESAFAPQSIRRPHVDASGAGPLVAFDTAYSEEDFTEVFIGRAGAGSDFELFNLDGFTDNFGFSVLTGARVLDAADNEVVFSATQQDGTEGLYLVNGGGDIAQYVRAIATAETPVPGGTGNFNGLFNAGAKAPFSSVAAISNRSIVFSAYDAAGERGIYLAHDDGSLTMLISTRDSLDGKEIKDVQLADGNAIDGNQVAFLAVFDDNSQAIYVDELTPVQGYRILVQAALPETGHDFPASVVPAEIHGIAFNDANRNGAKDDEEVALSGRTLFIDANGNRALDPGEVSAVSDDAGSYFFTNIAPLASYVVTIQTEAGESKTTPTENDGAFIVTPSPGQIVTGINFGLAASDAGGAGTGSKLSGSLLISNNGNGVLGASASNFTSLLSGVLVYVDQDGDGELDLAEDADGDGRLDPGEDTNGNGRLDSGEPSTAPDAQGQYSFSGLENSNVQLRLKRRAGLAQTSPEVNQSFEENRVSVPVGPGGAAAGNFDNLAGAELAVTMSNANEVWILKIDNIGAATVLQKLPTHNTPIDVASADLNGDGWADLIVSNALGDRGKGNDISIFINQKDPARPFSATQALHYATQNVARPAGGPRGLAIADFNGDQKPDIAVANQLAREVAVFLNESTPQSVSFRLDARPAVGKNPLAIVAGQFTGSAALDLAVINNGDSTAGSSSVSILEGLGTGKFTLKSTIKVAAGPTGIATGDLNGDPQADLVVANYGSDKITILFGQGGGQFLVQEEDAGTGPISVAVLDADGDDDADIAVSNGSDAKNKNHLLVIRNQNGVFSAAEPAGSATFYPDAAFSVVAADFDGKAGKDLALVNPVLASGAGNATGQVAVYLNKVEANSSINVALETPREIGELNFGVAFPYHNVVKALDVTGDTKITAQDALAVINFINAFGIQPVPVKAPLTGPFYDTTNDGIVAARDALEVINRINAFGTDNGSGGEGEGTQAADAVPVTGPAPEHAEGDLLTILALDLTTQPRRRR